MARLMSHLVGAHLAQPPSTSSRSKTLRRAAQPLQRLFRRKARDLAKGFAARWRSLPERPTTTAEAGKRRGLGRSGRTHYRKAIAAVARAGTSIRDF